MTTAELQALSDSELIGKVATEVMGWHAGQPQHCPSCSCWMNDSGGLQYPFMECSFHARESLFDERWDPLTDWNHWREVEERVTANDEIGLEFVEALGFTGIRNYSAASLRTRCIAALLAVE